MKTKLLNVATVLAALTIAATMDEHQGSQAQDKLGATISTNWVGGLVIGKRESGDPIAGRNLFPQTDAEIEIGLRSDGVLVWRKRP